MQDADADKTTEWEQMDFFFNCYLMLCYVEQWINPRECKQQSDKDKGKERRETQVEIIKREKRQEATEAGSEITTK